MNLKQLIVVRPPEGLFEIWTRKEYDDYMTYTVSAGAVPAYSIVTHFNEDERLTNEELKESGGMNLQQVFDKHIHYWANNEGEAFISSRDSEENKLPQAIKNAMTEYAAQFAGTREDWVSVEDRMPEHNVGVLVFIPAEDNHITSGMWDISNEWVLLDEYRSPKGEVTHWRKLPNPPNTNILKPI